MKEENSNTRIQTAISRELVHLDNMRQRVRTISNRYAHRSYIERILLRIDYAERSFKELRDRITFDEVAEEIRQELEEKSNKKNNTTTGKAKAKGERRKNEDRET